MLKIALLCLLSTASARVLRAQTTLQDCHTTISNLYPRQYIAYHTNTPPVLDGALDDPVWLEVGWTEAFVDISTNIVPRFQTRAKIRWDDEFLYVGAMLEEPDVWANITKHNEVIFHDNDFEVFVDADGSTHNYKEFEMNANNATWDLLLNKPYDDGGYENSTRVFPDNGWEMQPPLHSQTFIDGKINDPRDSRPGKFWSAEVALPLAKLAEFKSANLPPKNRDMWRINFSRVEWHVIVINNTYQKDPQLPTEDNWVWSPQGEIAMHLPERWGFLQFSTDSPNNTQIIRSRDWASRSIAMDLYYAQHAFFSVEKKFSNSSKVLSAFAPNGLLDGECGSVVGIEMKGSEDSGFVATVSAEGFLATVTDDRFLTTAPAGV